MDPFDPFNGLEPAREDGRVQEYSEEGVCPYCGVHYDNFETGLTFQGVYAMMWVDSEDPEKWVYKTRRCVLRRWRSLKNDLWEEHVSHCNGEAPEKSLRGDLPVLGGASQRDRLYTLLHDLLWHPWPELAEAGGRRYGARLLELRRLGYEISSRAHPGGGKEYRLNSREPGPKHERRVRVLLTEKEIRALLTGEPTSVTRSTLEKALARFRYNKHNL